MRHSHVLKRAGPVLVRVWPHRDAVGAVVHHRRGEVEHLRQGHQEAHHPDTHRDLKKEKYMYNKNKIMFFSHQYSCLPRGPGGEGTHDGIVPAEKRDFCLNNTCIKNSYTASTSADLHKALLHIETRDSFQA